MLGKFAVAVALFTGVVAQTTAPEWGQCGGTGWTGATTCPSGWVCTYSNEYYSQCLQGTASSSSATAPATSTTSASSGGGGTSSIPSGTATAGPTGATLLTGNLWVRADEEPDFHTYLQSAGVWHCWPGCVWSYTTAAQFQLNNGQVGATAGRRKCSLSQCEHHNCIKCYLPPDILRNDGGGHGDLGIPGDGLTWTAASIPRQDIGAFLACGTGVPSVNVNLGAYDYMTPAGCADETLNYYNGATAVD
ncbi:carbohydrate-binding module family 1 protein [Phellopilus nigrolimitatus]|nr:carbohydrate-binding module family 1 protein [Phellopilus nigrolimitatus]